MKSRSRRRKDEHQGTASSCAVEQRKVRREPRNAGRTYERIRREATTALKAFALLDLVVFCIRCRVVLELAHEPCALLLELGVGTLRGLAFAFPRGGGLKQIVRSDMLKTENGWAGVKILRMGVGPNANDLRITEVRADKDDLIVYVGKRLNRRCLYNR